MQATTPADPSAPRPKFNSLSSLRFLAAMSVVVFHYFSLTLFWSTSEGSTTQLDPISRFLGNYVHALTNGHLAVGFFFVLSGFVLAYTNFYLMEDGRFDYFRFLKRRFARIYPLHFLVTIAYGGLYLLAICVGIHVNNTENFTFSAFLTNIFLIRGLNLIGRLTYDGPAWYVSSQWHLYLLFPLLGTCVLRSPLRSVATLMATIAIFLGLYYATSGEQLLTHRTYDFGILRAVAEFPIGLALYLVFRDYQRSGAKFVRPIHVVGAATAVLLSAQFGLEECFIILLLAALIFTCAAAELHFELKWLTHPWLLYGGQISYAIYLIHVPFLACVRKTLPLIGVSRGSMEMGFLLVASAILVLPTSALVYHCLERPTTEWMLNLSAHSKKRTLSAA